MQSIKAKAFCLLAKRSYFTKELEEKLRGKGYSAEEIAPLIAELTEGGWLNDQELAARFVKRQQDKGYGARVILQKLMQKGGDIPIEVADGEIEVLIEKKYRKKLPEGREKVIAALLRRGFSYDLIHKALASISREDDHSPF